MRQKDICRTCHERLTGFVDRAGNAICAKCLAALNGQAEQGAMFPPEPVKPRREWDR